MYQHVTIVGNVGRSPELRYLQSGKAVCDFSVAVNRRWSSDDGEQREKTWWFRVTCWGPLAETANSYVYKGMRVLVTGEIDASAYIGNDGEARASLDLTARELKFLSSRDEREAAGPPPPDESADIPFR